MRSLRDVLVTDYGSDLTGWTLERANGVSPDGLTIVGDGTNPNGDREAWIARLPRCQRHVDVFPVGPPQGDCVVDKDDILYMLLAYADDDPCANFPGTDLLPCESPCSRVDIDDIITALRAFAGINDCPDP